MKKAFSLVELSIVLVILGLLVGGILAGQSLIRAAELRAVTTQTDAIKTAFAVFKDKYFSVPGDMNNAETFWGTDPDGCPAHTNFVVKEETCNGNGDGEIADNGGVALAERYRAWQHLANAGLVGGQYAGVSDGIVGSNQRRPGLNVLAAETGGTSHFNLYYIGPTTGGNVFPGYYGNIISLNTDDTSDGALNPEELWSIDKKIDDGMPGQGVLTTNTLVAPYDDCVDGNGVDAEYVLAGTSDLRCRMHVKSGF